MRLFSCGVPLPEAELIIGLIHYFQPLGEAFLRGALDAVVRGLLAGRCPWVQDEDDLCDLPLCWVQDKSTGLSFRQCFNIASACFEVNTPCSVGFVWVSHIQQICINMIVMEHG
jgi:hypothetical protein